MRTTIAIKVERLVEVEINEWVAPDKCYLVFDNAAAIVMLSRELAVKLNDELTEIIKGWNDEGN